MRTARLFRENTKKLRITVPRSYCDILPSSKVVIIKKKPENNEDVNLKKEKVTKNENVQQQAEEYNVISSNSEEFRVNEVNIQMISKNIYEQLFKKPSQRVDPQVIKSHLPDVQLKLPKLEGNDVVEHFYNIGEQQSAPYRELLKRLANCELPPMPKKWSKTSGWTKYSGESQESVACPPDNALIFDVEVLMSAGKRPTLACAVSTDAWYGWISEPLANDDPHKVFDNINYDDLIPLETDDKQTRDIFVDGTMQDVHENFQTLMQYCANDVVATHEVLKELLPLFLHRFPHPVTLAGMLELGSAYLPVNSNWLQYIDSAETVFEDLKLESRQILSMKADEACSMLNDNSYKKFVDVGPRLVSTEPKAKKDKHKKEKKDFQNSSTENNEEVIEDLSKEFEYLFELGEHLPVKRPYLPGYPAWYRKLCTKPGKDPDWSPGANNITTSMQLLRLSWEGYPLHYIKEEGWGFLVPYSRRRSEDAEEPLVPIDELLQACPLTFCKDSEFKPDVYTLPKNVEEDLGRRAYYARKKKDEQAAANQYHGLGVWSGIDVQGCCHFLRLPHKDGPKYKVGNPLAKDFLEMFSQNVLSAQGNEAEKVLTFGRMMSYWRNNRERILSQQVVWLPEEFLPPSLRDSEGPSTAFLSGRLSRALEHAQGRWGGTRLNWAVQSAAADFLHLMLASMAHLAPKARVGINDLPLSVAFFTAVEVDQVLRKESNLDCTTPSNPHGLDKGYGIPNGESLNIFEVLDKCKLNKSVE
ncbi:hypothetical protein HF086_012789 [Spodoptera exigua]|uniref:DNA mitochondrial polymerase exonuclease domain-containing protein n=1 Tax=Spodoptera exigua TaxID=7107 RepID=A0A922SID2_SPOEX|nr:hypothetical protein HF086_012789 [Spodoptera exigua]